jgi:hypothetical protein
MRALTEGKFAVGCNRFYVQSPCNFLIENYTEIFSTICERNISSIQCKNRFGWSNSMGEVDCLSLFFIDFYVPALSLGCY